MGETLYSCARCGYQLLTEAETERHMVFPPPQVSRTQIVGQGLYKSVCKNGADCARRIKDAVAGRAALNRASKNLVT